MAAAASPQTTPRPSISEHPQDSMLTPTGSPQQERRNLGPPSPVIAASSSNHTNTSSSSGKGLPSALKPIGIVNEQNTCFLNSTFQALSATRPLISLLTSSESSSLGPSSSLPRPIFPSSLIPALQEDALEPPLFELLPVTRAFINNLHRSWKMKDAGGGTYGSGETSAGKCMSLRTVLREIARKYDQYDDYRQQDAHELLRHLLDSMEMEEKDVIKKLQPEQMKPRPKRIHAGLKGMSGSGRDMAGISPMPSPLPSPAPSQPSSPVRQHFDPMARAVMGQGGQGKVEEEEWREIPENQKLVPFVDVLFGGSLASVVVCEKCKSVSHTYEGFLDISLSMKDEPRTRKRDKIMSLFRPKVGNSKPANEASISETELSDTEHTSKGKHDRRKSMDHDEGDSAPIRRGSGKGFGLKGISFGKKKKESSSEVSRSGSISGDSEKASIAESASSAGTATTGHNHSTTPVAIPGSPVVAAGGGWKHVHGPGPTPAQAAYIQRILANQGTSEPMDPLAKLRAANNGEGLAVNNASQSGMAEYGLIDCLKAFTAVEVLEGENSFACKKCWRIKSGKYEGMEPVLKEEDEAMEHVSSATVPPISIITDNSIISGIDSDDRPSMRHPSITSTSHSANIRAPSPLRRQIPDTSSTSGAETSSLSSSNNAYSVSPSTESEMVSHVGTSTIDGDGDEGTDGLSDTSEESDVGISQPVVIPVGRPKMAPRKKSTHFVHRRAFKRYLIAKAPEVLVLHLKRFRQTQKTSMTFTSFTDLKKMDDYVSFPERLDLAPFLAPNRSDYKISQTASGPRAPYMDWASPEHGPESAPVWYNLYAVVVHLGTMIGGHYIAYTLIDPEKMFEEGKQVLDAVRNLDLNDGHGADGEDIPSMGNGGGKRVWCYCSDTSIRLASLDEVLKAKAYLCFYEKAH